MGKRIEKANLPTKTCPVCGRPFAWRKKWAKDWDTVVYCSERCRREAKAKQPKSEVVGCFACAGNDRIV